MRRNIKTILIINSYLLIVLGIVLFIPLLISIYFNESKQIFNSFLIPAVISLIVGALLSLVIFKKNKLNLSVSTSMIAVSTAWICSSLIGAVPLTMGLNIGFLDAFFESVSGFTTTGITIITGLNDIPKSIILWRSLMQWLGGLGILTFFLLITFRSEGNYWQLFSAESHKISLSRPVPNIFRTIKIFWGIYILFTLMEIIILLFFKMSFFDAVIHSFTTLSTGGFSNYDNSIGFFADSGHPYYKQIEYTIIFFMALGGINFLLHYRLLSGDIKEFIHNIEFKYFRRIILGFTSLIVLGKLLISSDTFSRLETTIRTTLFQVVSVMTTTGYLTENIDSAFFPAVAGILFLVLMLIGGCVGSTSGGIKVLRIVLLNKLFLRETKKIYYPEHSVLPVTMETNIIKKDEIYRISALFFFWVLLILIGAVITSLFSDLNTIQSLSGMFSAVGNVGPFFFSVDKMISLSPVIKITYIIGMLAGRLEILPLFILFSRKAWKA